MAKAKKQVLTQEELLEQALVPESEQPYPVPGNWVWTRLNCLSNILNGYAFKSQLYSDAGIRVIRITNVQDGYVEDNKPEYYPMDLQDEIAKYLLYADDLLVSLTGNVGRVALLPSDMLPAALNQRVACLRVKGSTFIKKQYIFYYLLRRGFIDECIKSSKGSAQLNMSTEWLKIYPIPLPPLAEQRRIVERIESLFEKLDRAKELAQNALDSFEIRKAAILHKAFTGELTAHWREQNGVGMGSWKKDPLSNLAFVQTGLAKGKKNNSDTVLMPYLRVANVQDGFLALDEIKKIEVEVHSVSRYTLQIGDVLFTEGGDYDKLGRGTVWRGQIQKCMHQNHIFAVRPNQELLDSDYLAYLAGSRYGKSYFLSCSKQTTNLASINSTQLKAFPIPRPSLPEQQEIVRILDDLFEKEQRARELCDVIDKIDLMKKAILARAFRGELGTNDPNEESAVGLLREVLA